jgi:HlyD family secretion protein
MATKKSKYLNKIIIGLLLIVVLAVVARSQGWIGGNKDVLVEVKPVERRDIISTVSESGNIQPDIEVPVAPDVSGEVVGVYVKEGDSVKAGQLLIVIRPDNYQAAKEQSEASVNSAKADYAQAQANLEQTRNNLVQDSINYERSAKLYKDKVISQSEYENAQLRFKLTQSQLRAGLQTINASYYRMKSSEASLRQASDNLSRTSIYASMAGIVTMMKVEVGQRVVGTGQMAGTEIMKISDLSQMEVAVEVNENDIVNVRIGDSASIEVDAFPNKKFYGQVSEIAYSATVMGSGTTDQITNFKVRISVDRNSYIQDAQLMRGIPVNQSPFRPGMSAQVQIFTERKDQVIAVPIQSVTLEKKDDDANAQDAEKNAEIVFVYENGMVRSVPVKTGISDERFIEIEDGLTEGTQVITGPYRVISKELVDGMVVKIQDPKSKKPLVESSEE